VVTGATELVATSVVVVVDVVVVGVVVGAGADVEEAGTVVAGTALPEVASVHPAARVHAAYVTSARPSERPRPRRRRFDGPRSGVAELLVIAPRPVPSTRSARRRW
jgi:hypothetical protein